MRARQRRAHGLSSAAPRRTGADGCCRTACSPRLVPQSARDARVRACMGERAQCVRCLGRYAVRVCVLPWGLLLVGAAATWVAVKAGVRACVGGCLGDVAPASVSALMRRLRHVPCIPGLRAMPRAPLHCPGQKAEPHLAPADVCGKGGSPTPDGSIPGTSPGALPPRPASPVDVVDTGIRIAL